MKILCLIAFAVAVQWAKWPLLATSGMAVACLLVWRRTSTFLAILRRARWLMLSILLIYAYATPGEYVVGIPDWIAPTYEGLSTGLLQIGRLATMLGALSLLLSTSSREDIMAGVYLLIQPLRLLGIAPERFAARLWLTLHYVEIMPQGIFQRLRQSDWRLEDILKESIERPDTIQMQCPALRPADFAVLVLLPALLWWLA